MKTKTIRRYIEKKHYTRKEGGGSFYKWFDITFSDNRIEVHHLHSIEEAKKLPTVGSGSGFTLEIREAKILTKALNKILNL